MASYSIQVARKNLFIFLHHRRVAGNPDSYVWRGEYGGQKGFQRPEILRADAFL
jgi:hypothetical protein